MSLLLCSLLPSLPNSNENRQPAPRLAVGGQGETDPLLAPIELYIILAHEDIAKDPERLLRGAEAQLAETIGTVDDEVLLIQNVVPAAERKRKAGHRRIASH